MSMELKNISPFELQANPWNSNRVDRDNFEKLKKSLQSLSCFKPVVARELSDGSLQILGGYHRNEAAKELGFPTVPVVIIGKLDDDRAKEISLVDNTRYGQDDAEALAKLLDSFETDLLEEILPEASVLDIPETADALARLDEELKATREAEDDFKVLKFRLSNEKAEEVESLLMSEARRLNFKYPDGYFNLNEALHFVIERYKGEF
jgi:ParB-like chromosome segregation protein Spo0J